VGFGHESRAALLPVDDEPDLIRVGMKAVKYGKVAFTRHTEGMGDALGHKALNKKMAGKLCCHPDIVPPECGPHGCSLRVAPCPPRGPLRLRAGGAGPAALAGQDGSGDSLEFLAANASAQAWALAQAHWKL
jgi:hypothetical protein